MRKSKISSMRIDILGETSNSLVTEAMFQIFSFPIDIHAHRKADTNFNPPKAVLMFLRIDLFTLFAMNIVET